MKVIAKPIEMVAWFDKTGKTHPVRFRIENEDGIYRTIVIGKILKINLEKLAGNHMQVFTCRSNISGKDTIYEIKFELNTSRWILFKI